MKLDAANFRAVGKPIPRKEDERLITGHGRFSDDFNLDGQAYAVMVRSPHPHARIRGIDAARAQAMPGVLGVFTGADCLADGLGAIPHDPLPKTRYDMKLTGPGGGTVFIGPHLLLAGRQGAPRRRAGGDGGGREHGAGARCRRGGRGRIRAAARGLPFGRRDGARRAGNLGRGARQRAGRHLVRRSQRDRPGVRGRRPRGGVRLPYRSRHRRAARAARGARRITTRRAGATRSMPAAAARCGRSASSRPCSASHPRACACSPTTSAAISAPATACSSSSG